MGHRITLRDLARGAVRTARKAPALAVAARVALRSDPDVCLSIGALITENARRWDRLPAVLFEDRVLTHGELERRSNRLAHGLADRGIGKGDPVVVLLDNRPELLVCVAALVKLGAIAALINTHQRGRVLAHSLEISHAAHALVGEEHSEAFDEAVADDDEVAARFGDGAVFVVPGGWGQAAGAATSALARDALDAVAEGQPDTPPAAMDEVRLGDPCFYIYTSGTTGLPKASVMTHMRWMKASAAFGRAMLNLSASDAIYVPLPLYHNMALTVAWASAAGTGAGMIIRRRFSASEFWDDCRRYGATAIAYIGEIPRYLLNRPCASGDRRHAVRKATGVGMRADWWVDFQERFCVEEIYETYSASEANTMFVNVLNLDRTVGFCPTPHALVRYDVERGEIIRDAEGRLVEVADGEVGLLVSEITDRYGFDGYTNAEASEAKLLRNAFVDGDLWYDSGDLLRKIGWGHAAFVDRVGDTFRWKSENVSTSEVERSVNAHTQVVESTVYGVEVPGASGRAGMAAIVASVAPESFDMDALVRRCRDELPPYAVPVFVRLRQSLEVTGTFKHRKGALRQQGYDPARSGDPVWYLAAGADGYTPVTPTVIAALERAEVRL